MRVAVLSLVLLAGCVSRDLDSLSFGSTTNGATCTPTFEPCGGDPRGDWVHALTCGPSGYGSLVRQICPEATIESDERSSAAVLTIGLASYQHEDLLEESFVEFLWPASCQMGACASEGLRIEYMIDASVTCSEMGADCRCRVVTTAVKNITVGYQITDNLITLDSTLLPSVRFCVEGDTLRLEPQCADGPGCDHVDVFTR